MIIFDGKSVCRLEINWKLNIRQVHLGCSDAYWSYCWTLVDQLLIHSSSFNVVWSLFQQQWFHCTDLKRMNQCKLYTNGIWYIVVSLQSSLVVQSNDPFYKGIPQFQTSNSHHGWFFDVIWTLELKQNLELAFKYRTPVFVLACLGKFFTWCIQGFRRQNV